MFEKALAWLKEWITKARHNARKHAFSETPFLSSMDENQKQRIDSLSQIYQRHDKNVTPELNSILDNLKVLKHILEGPKEDAPELRFTQIKEHLGTGENHETVRQDRWYPTIRCPSCQATDIKRIPIPPDTDQSPHNYRYACQACGHEFNDDSGTPFERGLPPLSVWMQCWYLMGCTNSLTYIAQKLGLELSVVEYMVEQLQKTFNAEQPLTHFVDYRDRFKQSTQLQQKMKSEERQKKEELVTSADVPDAPKDTAEYRKQKERRKHPTSTWKKT